MTDLEAPERSKINDASTNDAGAERREINNASTNDAGAGAGVGVGAGAGSSQIAADADSIISVTSSNETRVLVPHPAILFCVVIVILGIGATAATIFIALGITDVKNKQDEQFERRASELVNAIKTSWSAYEVAGLYVHDVGRQGVSRRRFRELYENLISTGLEFQVTSYNPNVTHDKRAVFEAESRAYYGQFYPNITYTGIVGLEPDPNDPDSLSVQNRSNQSFYFPVHYLEPISGNEDAIDFDLYSSASRAQTIRGCLETWLPALTPRLRLVQETDPNAYSVILMHPGVPLSTDMNLTTRDFSSMVVRIPDLLLAANRLQSESSSVYIYDSTLPNTPPEFLGGETFLIDANGNVEQDRVEPEISLYELHKTTTTMIKEATINVASRQWSIAVVALPGTYEEDTALVVVGGIVIFTGSVCLALWLCSAMMRHSKMNRLQARAEREKAAIIVQSARKAAKAERELNDYLAHEVRNTLAGAMTACSFVSSAVNDETKPLTDPGLRQSLQDDCTIISTSLDFINDLLRNMLDLQRASSDHMEIELSPVNILRDVFQPVDAMIYRRKDNFEFVLDCPDDLVVATDGLRLKQIILNLGKNSSKFVDHGFVRLRSSIVNDCVVLYVEDSGPGIPKANREFLFSKCQESLDTLKQGTGIGLSLCKKLSNVMGARLSHDASYDSGIKGCPGTRFVINLNVPPIKIDDRGLDSLEWSPLLQPDTENAIPTNKIEYTLPENMSLLFVDDDLVLRKLFSRSIKRTAPGWTVQEAASGEEALRLVDAGESFGIIFMDQYMASTEKQLLGTETVRYMRAKGVTSRICGLSANDMGHAFYEAGADAFMLKPFPCGSSLSKELFRVLYSERPTDR